MGVGAVPVPARRRMRGGWSVVRCGILVAAAVVAVGPLVYMFLTAIRRARAYYAEPFSLPHDLYIGNVKRILDLSIGRWILNSVMVTSASVLIATVLAVFAGYGYARLSPPGGQMILTLTASLMVVPPVVMLIPLFLFASTLRLVDNPIAVIVAYSGLMLPFSVFVFARFAKTVPDELHEAAKIDGASHLQILRTVVVPLAMPTIVTLLVVNALYSWNELLIASVFLQSTSRLTVPAGLALLNGKEQTDVPLVMAGAVLSTVPMLAAYIIAQRQFVRGLVEGAVK